MQLQIQKNLEKKVYQFKINLLIVNKIILVIVVIGVVVAIVLFVGFLININKMKANNENTKIAK